ncbi:MAG TPA: chloride channel protein [Flavobacterium sp.]
MASSQIQKRAFRIRWQKLVLASVLTGFLAAFLALSLKGLTEYYEFRLFERASASLVYSLTLPFIGLSVIYFLREYLFRKKVNKGITEIFECTASGKNTLPLYKIPSHFLNGLITVAFGGSTGIEVSTVVASAAIGTASQKENLLRHYKTELICAGIAAGITALFNSPIAGLFFAYEVIYRRMTKSFLIATLPAVAISYALVIILNEKSLFNISITTWHLKAAPYFVLLGILAGVISVYLTRCVMVVKTLFSKIRVYFHRIILGAFILSVSIIFLPQLYGDGYHAMNDFFLHPETTLSISLIATLVLLLMLKPIVTSITLASGGDGGVFAPSLFIGAFLGLTVASILNMYFNVGVIAINFMVIGMAAVLSASIHAPLTALFLICGLTGDYKLFVPLLVICFISKYTAKALYPKTVYSFTVK